jgi:hypothetical protein
MKRGDWTPVYMLIVAIIAVILIMTFIKPVFQNAGSATTANAQAASKAVTGGFALLFPRQKD